MPRDRLVRAGRAVGVERYDAVDGVQRAIYVANSDEYVGDLPRELHRRHYRKRANVQALRGDIAFARHRIERVCWL